MHPVARIVQDKINVVKNLIQYDIDSHPDWFMHDWYLGETKYKKLFKNYNLLIL